MELKGIRVVGGGWVWMGVVGRGVGVGGERGGVGGVGVGVGWVGEEWWGWGGWGGRWGGEVCERVGEEMVDGRAGGGLSWRASISFQIIHAVTSNVIEISCSNKVEISRFLHRGTVK